MRLGVVRNDRGGDCVTDISAYVTDISAGTHGTIRQSRGRNKWFLSEDRNGYCVECPENKRLYIGYKWSHPRRTGT